MQANLLSLLTTGSGSAQAGSPASHPAQSVAHDAFAQMLERHRQAQASRTPPPVAERSPAPRTDAAPSRQAADTARDSDRRDAARASERANEPAASPPPTSAATTTTTPSSPASTTAADSAADSPTAETDAAASTPAQAAAASATPAANLLVAQIQQLTERSRALADTVVALKTHPETVPEAAALLPELAAPATDAAAPLADLATSTAPANPAAGASAVPAELAALAAATPPTQTNTAATTTAATAPTPTAWQAPRPAPALPLADLAATTVAAAVPEATPDVAPALPEASATPSGLQGGTPITLALVEPAPRFATPVGAAAAPGAMPGAPGSSLSGVLQAPLGAPHWGQAFSQQMVRFSTDGGSGLRHIEMRLDPPDLGPVRISLSLAGEQASALFLSPHAAVRQAIEQALPQLHAALAEAGIQLGQTSVGEHGQEPDRSPASAPATLARGGTEAGDNTELTPAPRVVSRGLVDTFA